jgi:hypothetical protein
MCACRGARLPILQCIERAIRQGATSRDFLRADRVVESEEDASSFVASDLEDGDDEEGVAGTESEDFD